MLRSKALTLIALLACAGASAQILAEDPDWRESTVTSAPAFDVKRLIRLESPPGSSLAFGVDPATLLVTPEGVVRYVIVASGPGGSLNVMYEGIRCSTAQYRIYARHHTETGWTQVRDGDWESLFGSASARHALTFARAGACTGRSANTSADTIIRTLKTDRQTGYE